jgi:hypothetical protein
MTIAGVFPRTIGRSRIMRAIVVRSGVALALFLVAGCGLQSDPPPSFPITDFGGTGDLMARCMQYASESYCEREVWGGNEQ